MQTEMIILQQQIDAANRHLQQLLNARVAMQSGDALSIEIFAAGMVGSKVLADEPVYIPVDEFEQAARRDAYFVEVEMMRYDNI